MIILTDFSSFLKQSINKIEYFLIESATPSWDHDYNLIKEIKKKYPNLKIVVAGPISTSDEKWDSDIIHAILKGEYEKNIIKVFQFLVIMDIILNIMIYIRTPSSYYNIRFLFFTFSLK